MREKIKKVGKNFGNQLYLLFEKYSNMNKTEQLICEVVAIFVFAVVFVIIASITSGGGFSSGGGREMSECAYCGKAGSYTTTSGLPLCHKHYNRYMFG